jgi:hypothetical protein
MIFKAGKYAQGDWSKERVQKMVDAYDPEKNIEAPVVIGHRWYSETDEHEYAHGWVKSLRMDGAGKVYADVPEFSSKLKQALAEKNLRYVSAEIYEFDKRDANEPPYLRAVSLLGRNPPAVQGTRLPALYELFTGGAVTTLDEKEMVAAFTRRVTAEDCKRIKDEPVTAFSKEGSMGEEEKLKAELTAKSAEAAAFKKELDDLRNAGKKQEAEGYYGKLRDAGRLPPALFEKAVSLDTRLGEEERKELRGLVGEFEKTVDLSGKHAADKNSVSTPAGDGLTAKIRAFQKEKGITSFAAAAEALYAAHPALFEEGAR